MFVDLPRDLLASVVSYLPVKSVLAVSQTCSRLHGDLCGTVEGYRRVIESLRRPVRLDTSGRSGKLVSRCEGDRFIYPDWLIEAVGGHLAMAAIPVLDLKGADANVDVYSGYIDFVRPEHLRFPVMRGVDSDQRAFLTMRWVKRSRCTEKNDAGSDEQRFVSNIFQRYRHSPKQWAYGVFGSGGLFTGVYWNSRILLHHVPQLRDRIRRLVLERRWIGSIKTFADELTDEEALRWLESVKPSGDEPEAAVSSDQTTRCQPMPEDKGVEPESAVHGLCLV